MLYSLLLNYPELAERELDEETLAAGQAAFAAFAHDLDSEGAFISASILQPTVTSTTVSRRSGTLEIQDGPFADTKEKFAGIFLIEVPDLDRALEWAQKCPAVDWGVVEVRPAALVYRDGEWRQVG
jgi:hypothetical protein